ncbi:MAG: O-antigen ligase family protein [candidate division WOR-3 bacterium]
MKIILYIIAFFSLITLITTLLNLIKNPFITRIIKNYGYTKEYAISNNIGGYEFIYYSVLVFILLFYFLINFYSKINKKKLVVLTIIIILIPLLVVMSNYFIAFLILVISIFLVLIFKLSKKNTYLKLFILFLSIILIYNFYTEKILDFFIDKTTGLNKTRLQELKDSYLESKEFNLETNRWQLYKVSFNTFLETPLLGVIGKEKELIFGTTTSSGQHSHFLDSLVYLGLFLSLLQLYVIFRPFFIYIKDKTFNDLVFTFLCSFLIIFLFNNLTPSMSIPLFFIFPYLYDKMLEMINYEKD